MADKSISRQSLSKVRQSISNLTLPYLNPSHKIHNCWINNYSLKNLGWWTFTKDLDGGCS